jgi:hypothetical protein
MGQAAHCNGKRCAGKWQRPQFPLDEDMNSVLDGRGGPGPPPTQDAKTKPEAERSQLETRSKTDSIVKT